MNTTTPERITRLDSILEARRKQVRFRLALAGCIIVFYQQMLGLGPTLVWAGLYGLLQFAELKLLPREGRLAVLATPMGNRAALALLLLNTLVFGSLAVLWPLRSGAWGAANGAFLVAGAMLNTVLPTISGRWRLW